MHRMTQQKQSSCYVAAMALAMGAACSGLAGSSPVCGVRHADVDFEASGYVTPAGMAHPSMYQSAYPSGIMQVERRSRLGGGGHGDAAMYGGGGCDSCDVGGGALRLRFVMGWAVATGSAVARQLRRRLRLCCSKLLKAVCLARCVPTWNLLYPPSLPVLSRQRLRCLSGAELLPGDGPLSASLLGSRHLYSALVRSLGRRCLSGTYQRWPKWCPHDRRGQHHPSSQSERCRRRRLAASRCAGLRIVDLWRRVQHGRDLRRRAGVGRPGGVFADPAGTPTLFSFIRDFGTNPQDTGFDDTDRSLVQSLQASSDFHSVEWNYRRRTMGPYCRFQGSWLVGLRYVRFDDRLVYRTLGENDNTVNADLPRFFSSNDRIKNNLFGPQAGFDLWWNVTPGVNLGVGMKGAWVQNDAKRQTILTANSLDPLATPGTMALTDTERYGTVIGELEATLIYRFTHSLSFRTSYYAVAVDDVAFGTVDGGVARDFVTVTARSRIRPYHRHSLVVQGFSFGTEYIW